MSEATIDKINRVTKVIEETTTWVLIAGGIILILALII